MQSETLPCSLNGDDARRVPISGRWLPSLFTRPVTTENRRHKGSPHEPTRHGQWMACLVFTHLLLVPTAFILDVSSGHSTYQQRQNTSLYHPLVPPTCVTTMSTDLPPITLLLQEIQTLTSSMRRNQRWATGTTQHFSTSQAPLPPYLHASRKRRSLVNAQSVGNANGGGGGVNINEPRRSRGGERDGGEEGDLMVGFVELRRMLNDAKGE